MNAFVDIGEQLERASEGFRRSLGPTQENARDRREQLADLAHRLEFANDGGQLAIEQRDAQAVRYALSALHPALHALPATQRGTAAEIAARAAREAVRVCLTHNTALTDAQLRGVVTRVLQDCAHLIGGDA